MKKPVIIGLLSLPVVLVGAALLLLLWIFETGSGTRWLWARAESLTDGRLAARAVEGSLGDGLVVSGFVFRAEGSAVRIDRLALTLDPDVLPLAVRLRDLQVGTVGIRQQAGPDPGEPGARLDELLRSLSLPVPVIIEDLVLDHLEFSGPDGATRFAMGPLTLAGRWQDEIVLERFSVAVDALEASGRAALALSAPHAVSAGIAIDGRLDIAGQPSPVSVALDLAGSLEELGVTVDGREPALRLTGTLRNVVDTPRFDIRVTSEELTWPLSGEDAVASARGLRIEARGEPDEYQVAATGTLATPRTGELAMSLEGAGDTRSLELRRLDLEGDLLATRAKGGIGWSDGIAAELRADLRRADPSQLLEAWPAGQAVTGSIAASFRPGTLDVDGVELRLAGTGTVIESEGVVDLDSGVVDLSVDWTDLEWPPASEKPELASRRGSLAWTGRPEDWRFDGRALLKAPGYPEGEFVLDGTGDLDSVSLRLKESAVLGGKVAGTAAFGWRGAKQWSVRLDTEGLQTGALAAAWPGRVSAGITASGQLEPLAFAADIRQLDGRVRDIPLRGEGSFRYGRGELRVDDLRVASGESFVEADGSLRGAGGLDFRLEVDAIGRYYPDAFGSVAASGNLSLREDFPSLTLELLAEDLAWRELRAGRLEAVSRADAAALPIDLDIEASEVAFGARSLDTLDASLAAGPSVQRVTMVAVKNDRRLALSLDGAFGDWRQPADSAWSGQLTALTLEAGDALSLGLREAANLELSASRLSLQRSCLDSADGLQLCAAAEWSDDGNLATSAEFTAVPVDLLQLVVDTGLEFTQTLDGSLVLSRSATRDLSGDVNIDVAPGRIRNRFDDRLSTITRAGKLELTLDDGEVLAGRLDLPFGSASRIEGTFNVIDVSRGEQSPVEGRLQVDVSDIGTLADITPMVDAAAGALMADVRVHGTVAEPQFEGGGSLTNGLLGYRPLGLELRDLQVAATMRDNNRVELEGTFQAGEGRGRIYTSADYLEGLQGGLQVALTGEDLTVIDVPDITVVANPDLDVRVYEGTVLLDGRILIPRARLSPVNLTDTPVRESSDVVVVAGGDPAEKAEEDNGPPVAIRGQVALELGDGIVIDLDVADASVTGLATFAWQGPPMPTAEGEYEVAGSFQAYGQLLEITEGEIRFPNVPADSPQLRIRAEREIFGNSQVRSAGVLVTGTPDSPNVEVYTNPATTQNRALTLLVTGSDFNFEQGVGAVDVGTYIAPKLYASYGVGLFDRENVISVRYDLGKGFGVKASSGRRAEGVDLSYTLER